MALDKGITNVCCKGIRFLFSLRASSRDAYERRLVEGGFCDGFWVDGAVGKGEEKE